MQRSRPPSAPALVHALLRQRLVSGRVLVLGDAGVARALVRRGHRVTERLQRGEPSGRDPFGVRTAEAHDTVLDLGWWDTIPAGQHGHYLRELHAVTGSGGFLHAAVPAGHVPDLLDLGKAEWGLFTVHDDAAAACGGPDGVLVSLHRQARHPKPAVEPVRSFRDATAFAPRPDFDAGA